MLKAQCYITTILVGTSIVCRSALGERDLAMPTFSAEMTYEVAADGTATVRETRSVQNPSDTAVEFGSYKEVLPPSIDLSTLKCLLLHGETQRNLPFHVENCPGTDRKLFQIDQLPIVCLHGTTEIQTDCRITSFYSVLDDRQCDMFSFHHSLPDLPYFTDVLVHKRIVVVLQKPANRFLWKWSLLTSTPLVAGASERLEDCSRDIRLEYVFDISRTQHFYATVVLRRHRRFNFPGALLTAIKAAVLKKVGK